MNKKLQLTAMFELGVVLKEAGLSEKALNLALLPAWAIYERCCPYGNTECVGVSTLLGRGMARREHHFLQRVFELGKTGSTGCSQSDPFFAAFFDRLFQTRLSPLDPTQVREEDPFAPPGGSSQLPKYIYAAYLDLLAATDVNEPMLRKEICEQGLRFAELAEIDDVEINYQRGIW